MTWFFLLLVLLISQALLAQGKFIPQQNGELGKSLPVELQPANPVDVLHYDIYLHIDPTQKTINGTARLQARLTMKTEDSIHLDLISLAVDSLFINQKSLPILQEPERLFIKTADLPAEAETFEIKIVYHGQPGNDGFGGFFFADNVIFTVGEGLNSSPPSMLRFWVPSHDVPDDKATLDMKINVPDSLVAVSNGTLVETIVEQDRKIFHWQENFPIATYLIAISISDFDSFSDIYISAAGDTIPLEYFVYPQDIEDAKTDWHDVGKMMAFFENFITPYPFEKYGMVEVPMRGAMEHQTMTSYSDRLITGDNSYDEVVVHELAHQWWGNLVTLADWRDIWLNEGFASYCEGLYIEHQSGELALQEYIEGFKTAYLQEISRRGNFTLYDPEYLWGSTVYKKGAWVLHMLRWTLGRDVFEETLKSYAQMFAYGNAVTSQFQDVCESVSGQDLDWFFQQWVYGKGLPHLNVGWSYIELSQEKFSVNIMLQQVQMVDQLFILPIEIELLTASGAVRDTLLLDQKSKSFALDLDAKPVDLRIDPANWLLEETDIISRPLPEGIQEGKISLAQNYPNPFLPAQHEKGTQITFQIIWQNTPVDVSLIIYDVLGRKIRTLVEKRLPSGLHTFSWDGRDELSKPVTSGVYFYELSLHDERLRKKMTVVGD